MIQNKDVIKYIWKYLDGSDICAIGEDGKFFFTHSDGEEYSGMLSVRLNGIDDPEEVEAFIALANRSLDGDPSVLPADDPKRLCLGFIDGATEKLCQASLSLLKREYPDLLDRLMSKRRV